LVLRGWRSGADVDGKGPVLLVSILSGEIVHPGGFATIPVQESSTKAGERIYIEGLTGTQKLTAAGQAVFLAPL